MLPHDGLVPRGAFRQFPPHFDFRYVGRGFDQFCQGVKFLPSQLALAIEDHLATFMTPFVELGLKPLQLLVAPKSHHRGLAAGEEHGVLVLRIDPVDDSYV